ncbi:MAG: ATP-dependent RecD-like DNA helicase [Bacteroidales bacterium]
MIKQLSSGLRVNHFFNVLDQCRRISKENGGGKNLIRYLLYNFNNTIIKRQYRQDKCYLLSNLYFDFGCIPFDNMPFVFSLRGHNPRISDVFNCIEVEGREDELFARIIKNNTEQKGLLYTDKLELVGFEDIDRLIEKYNNKLYSKHGHRKIDQYKEHLFIMEYEEDTFKIINTLKELAQTGYKNFSNSVDDWLQSTSEVGCEEKKVSLKNMFEKSKVGLVYGSAGTGKSTLIRHIASFFNKDEKLFLANTNPAVDNLRRKVSAANSTYSTIAKFLYSNNLLEYDILIIDECSTVSNSDMLRILNKVEFKLLILVGDVFQIESILFGNWFNLAKVVIPKSAVFELVRPYRTKNESLLTLWDRVRNIDDKILECLTKNDYSKTLDDSIFENLEKDEIILCLNYDGLYGINNINRFLQSNNNNTQYVWGTHIYKVGDPVLFNETDRFSPLIYNNLKGRIEDIKILKDKIQFDIEIDKVINEFDAIGYNFELLDDSLDGKSVIRFYVNLFNSTDEDDTSKDSIVPFQIAYAVSIHKAQGLEYDSVKIVISDEVEEMISHNIFYTAITRARKNLKIYWTPETENKVLGNLKKVNMGRDISLFRSKYANQ